VAQAIFRYVLKKEEKRMKKMVLVALAATMAFSLAGCGGSTAPKTTAAASQAETTAAEQAAVPISDMKVGLILSTGGLGDKNFNDMAYDGLLRAQEEYGIEFDYVEPKSSSDFIPNYRMFAEAEEYDLIIGIGNDQLDAMKEIAEEFSGQKFSLIDASLDMPNVSSLSTKWQEQTFLTGVIAGLCTQADLPKSNPENVVGVVLGKDFPNLREGVVGFEAGVRYVNPDCEILEAVVDSFNDPGKGKEIALSMYNRNADFVQHIAGASGLGVFNAAKESDRYAFGVGGNQNANEPDYIVATAIRNVDEMVYGEVKAMAEGTWTPGAHVSGMAEGSVGYSTEDSKVALPADVVAAVEEIRANVISGELVPCSKAEELDAWVAVNQYK